MLLTLSVTWLFFLTIYDYFLTIHDYKSQIFDTQRFNPLFNKILQESDLTFFIVVYWPHLTSSKFKSIYFNPLIYKNLISVGLFYLWPFFWPLLATALHPLIHKGLSYYHLRFYTFNRLVFILQHSGNILVIQCYVI